MAPLLLYSLAEFRELIFACLDAVDARSLVEVGCEEAAFTEELLRWAEKRGGRVHCVEPEPGDLLLEVSQSSAAVHLYKQRSPEALEEVPPSDAYFLDGDHNYWTVLEELRTIARRRGGLGGAVVFLHDVGWPCARRDLYYSPESLPQDGVHPHTFARGVTPDSRHVVQGGHRGEGQFAWALEEGGSRNGVLTGVEDFLAEHSDLTMAMVPCLFGLGVVYSPSSPSAGALADVLRPYDDNVLLRRLEGNRLDLYLRVLELQDSLEATELYVRDVNTENRALVAQVRTLETQLEELTSRSQRLIGESDALLASRAFAIAERLSRLAGPKGPGGGLSRQRLRDAVEEARES
ncbi:MAG: class I SAM-dependent methyltransferase [Actinomycetota bacterium]|nr:class I SAM-dependent methyltransferase [Actinomycetota bacterium]